MKKKKYALNNSYFKNRVHTDPSTPYEVMEYLEEHGELPFDYHGENWMYDCYVEYQKRGKVFHAQFFTPDRTADRMAEIANDAFTEEGAHVLDACCGFGQLTRPLTTLGFIVHGFDASCEMVKMYGYNTSCLAEQCDFRSYEEKWQNIIANPPYEIKDLTDFLCWLHLSLEDNGVAILLIPDGFIDKERPKATAEAISRFRILHREPMTEEFARTKTRAEIVVLEKA